MYFDGVENPKWFDTVILEINQLNSVRKSPPCFRSVHNKGGIFSLFGKSKILKTSFLSFLAICNFKHFWIFCFLIFVIDLEQLIFVVFKKIRFFPKGPPFAILVFNTRLSLQGREREALIVSSLTFTCPRPNRSTSEYVRLKDVLNQCSCRAKSE